MHKIMTQIKRLGHIGLFHVMGSTFFNKIIAFITNVFIVRILNKYNYGLFSSAFNIFLIVILFSGFGITSATLFFASEKEEEHSRLLTYRFAIKYGFIVNIILCMVILCYGLFGHVGIEETRPYIISLSAMPLFFFFFDYYSIILRTRKENKRYALLLNINSVSYMVFAIVGSYLYGISGTIIGRYFSYILSAIIGFFFTRQYVHFKGMGTISSERKNQVLKYAGLSGAVTAFNTVLYKIDITLISLLVADASQLATYKVATVIPENMNFIPASILIVFLPLFIENSDNRQWIINNSKKVFKYMALLCGGISILLILFSRIAIKILFGAQYLDGVQVFRVLALSFFFLGTFRSTCTNILQALGKVKYNLIISIISGLFNIVLDYIFIRHLGIMGAAIATLIVTILASSISLPYLLKALNGNSINMHNSLE